MEVELSGLLWELNKKIIAQCLTFEVLNKHWWYRYPPFLRTFTGSSWSKKMNSSLNLALEAYLWHFIWWFLCINLVLQRSFSLGIPLDALIHYHIPTLGFSSSTRLIMSLRAHPSCQSVVNTSQWCASCKMEAKSFQTLGFKDANVRWTLLQQYTLAQDNSIHCPACFPHPSVSVGLRWVPSPRPGTCFPNAGDRHWHLELLGLSKFIGICVGFVFSLRWCFW